MERHTYLLEAGMFSLASKTLILVLIVLLAAVLGPFIEGLRQERPRESSDDSGIFYRFAIVQWPLCPCTRLRRSSTDKRARRTNSI